MRSNRFPRPSAAMIVAVAALIMACAGSATAASLITGQQIKNNTVASTDVKNNSLTGSDVRNRSLTTSDLSQATIAKLAGKPGPKGAVGASGAAGTTGAEGDKGDAGSPGQNAFGSLVYKESATIMVADNSFDTTTLTCDAGQFPISGGFVTPNSDDLVVKHSRPTTASGSQKGSAGWTVLMKNPLGGGTGQYNSYVVCAPAATVTGP